MTRSGVALLPLRAVVGLVFIMHGGQKLFVLGLDGTGKFMASVGIPLPDLAAVVVTAVELLGGLAILLGVGTRVAGVLLTIDMLVALIAVHMESGFFLPGGIEFVLTLMGASLTLAALGPGPLSVEGVMGRTMA